MSLASMSPVIVLSVLLLVSVAYNFHLHNDRQAIIDDRLVGDKSFLHGSTELATSSHGRKTLTEYTGTIPPYDPYSSSIEGVFSECFVLSTAILSYAHAAMRRKGAGFLTPPPDRLDFGRMLEALGGFKVGVELGVQRGHYANHILHHWPSCEKYYLVDLWAQQENYVDFANVPNKEQDDIFKEAQTVLKVWEAKTVFIKDCTTNAAKQIPDGLDYVYVDARHDYCGVMEDLETYWPKIRPGGIMAGHDYAASFDVHKISGQQWSICMNGTINHGAVRGAVDEFALKRGLFVSVTWGEDHIWKSWIIRKHHACVRE
eukprot:gene7720-891_t